MIESGVVNKDDLSKSKVAMVYGQMNEPPGNRLRVALTGLSIAESFRDDGRDVLLFIDNIYRFTLARHRVLGAARPHALRGGLSAYAGRGDGPPAGAHHLDQDRLDHLDPGRVRAGGRPDRSVACDHLRHLDATVVLSRDIASLGIYPSVDPLDSTSRRSTRT